MIILTSHQVARVQAHLALAGLNEKLSTELLDHLCCAIEARMATGYDFDDALSQTLKSWPLRQLQDLQKTIQFTTKTKPMLYRISAAAALLAGIAFLSPFPLTEVAIPLVAQVQDHNPGSPSDVARFDPPTGSPITKMDIFTDLSIGFGRHETPLKKLMKMHTGIDLRAKTGTRVVATADGRVIFAGEDNNYGIVVRLQHTDGYVTVYAHLSEHVVIQGDLVVFGEEIAAVGSTGASKFSHLHYEVHKDGVPVDPLALR